MFEQVAKAFYLLRKVVGQQHFKVQSSLLYFLKKVVLEYLGRSTPPPFQKERDAVFTCQDSSSSSINNIRCIFVVVHYGFNSTFITYNIAVETPFFAKNISQQFLVGTGWCSVDAEFVEQRQLSCFTWFFGILKE